MVGGTQGLALRQALTYGCDRQAVNNASSGGVLLPPTTGVVPPGVPGAQGVKEPYAYDPAKAKELVESRGPVTLALVYPIGQQQAAAARILTESYAKVGITIKAERDELETRPGNTWWRARPSCTSAVGSRTTRRWTTSSIRRSRAAPHRTAWARATRTPRSTRFSRRLAPRPISGRGYSGISEAERLVLADAPAIPLSVFADARLLNSRVANVRFNSMGWADCGERG